MFSKVYIISTADFLTEDMLCLRKGHNLGTNSVKGLDNLKIKRNSHSAFIMPQNDTTWNLLKA